MALKGNNKVIYFKLTTHNKGPLRIGSGDETVLIDKISDLPYLPGTSICGAIKNYLKDNFDADLVNTFLGSESGESKIVVFDSYGDKKAIERRPGLKINHRTGANEDRHKFDTEYLGAGHIFNMKFKAYAKDSEEMGKIKGMMFTAFSAMNKGILRLGGKKSAGAGIFEFDEVSMSEMDLLDTTDLKNYLLDKIEYGKVSWDKISQYGIENRIEIAVQCKTAGPILIQGQNQNDSMRVDNENIKNIKDEYIVPGTSIKGVLRNRCRKILSIKKEKELLVKLFGSETDEKDENKIRSRIMFEDIVVNNARKVVQPRIKLDKFTQKVFEGALLSSEVIEGEMDFSIMVEQKKDDTDDKLIALLMLALRDLCTEDLPIGSGTTIGRGRISGSRITLRTPSEEFIFQLDKKIDERSLNYINEKIQKLI